MASSWLQVDELIGREMSMANAALVAASPGRVRLIWALMLLSIFVFIIVFFVTLADNSTGSPRYIPAIAIILSVLVVVLGNRYVQSILAETMSTAVVPLLDAANARLAPFNVFLGYCSKHRRLNDSGRAYTISMFVAAWRVDPATRAIIVEDGSPAGSNGSAIKPSPPGVTSGYGMPAVLGVPVFTMPTALHPTPYVTAPGVQGSPPLQVYSGVPAPVGAGGTYAPYPPAGVQPQSFAPAAPSFAPPGAAHMYPPPPPPMGGMPMPLGQPGPYAGGAGSQYPQYGYPSSAYAGFPPATAPLPPPPTAPESSFSTGKL
ncbi:hypothetical protein EON67_02090 [archaeon]|nr:MAG: hypothetical protein EON67_02090 [archaeon]